MQLCVICVLCALVFGCTANVADLSPEAIAVLHRAVSLAREMGNPQAVPAHLALSICSHENGVAKLIQQKISFIHQQLENVTNREPKQHEGWDNAEISRNAAFQWVVETAKQIRKETQDSQVTIVHLLWALRKEKELGDILIPLFSPLAIPGLLSEQSGNEKEKAQQKIEDPLQRHGTDMTQLARQGTLDPVIGRDKEILQVIGILLRKTKNNPLLVGEPGVGKTAIVEGLAQRIANGDVPQSLVACKVIQLDLGGLVAGTQFRGEFEDKLKKVVDAVKSANGSVILFIDEIHMVLGAGSIGGGAMDAANLLKPALARGELKCIGATTMSEFRKYVSRDGAFERRFQQVTVEQPSVEDTVSMLRGRRGHYEVHHGVKILDEALVSAAELASRYLTSRKLPDSAIDLVDEACADARMEVRAWVGTKGPNDQEMEHEDVSIAQVAKVLSRWTGIPVAKLRLEQQSYLLTLADDLSKRVVGQGEAVSVVAEAILRARGGMMEQQGPMATLMFVGPSGVGKTELALLLAKELFEGQIVRMEMGDYSEAHSVAKLIGTAPGYVGYHDGGMLTEAVRKKPYTVILLEHLERAHPYVYQLLQQLVEQGQLIDGQGTAVDFKNVMVIITSNLGDNIHPSTPDARKNAVLAALYGKFKREFLERLGGIAMFSPLAHAHLEEILRLHLVNLDIQLKSKGISLHVSDDAISWVLNHFDFGEGARPLVRFVQQQLLTEISKLAMIGELVNGTTLEVRVREDNGISSLEYVITK